ncbi:MAG: glycine cleavage system protein GcvH [Rhodovibrionaceae bacterium]|nr:glycine cleavage system protein GcvH [Rhodovibrionaceae bacterium]
MSDTYYTEDHEWIRVQDGEATIGITDYAQEQLGDIVYVELPESGQTLEKGKEAAVVESVKAASEVYAPVSGEVTDANESLTDEPEKVNSDPTGDGWFFKMNLSDKSELDDLMDEGAYKEYVESLS